MSDANEVLRKMRQKKENANSQVESKVPDSPYVRLLIRPRRRRQLAAVIVLGFAIFLAILAHDMNIAKPWWYTSLPIIGLGLLICLIPPTEEWEYRPWQDHARKYEHHQVGP